jgi:Fe-S-cluster containining protein
VSFYWSEGRDLPDRLVGKVNDHLACMAGTNQPEPRCAALEGEIGKSVSCSAYALRPSPCREVQPGDEKCGRARMRHGLAPLPPRS